MSRSEESVRTGFGEGRRVGRRVGHARQGVARVFWVALAAMMLASVGLVPVRAAAQAKAASKPAAAANAAANGATTSPSPR